MNRLQSNEVQVSLGCPPSGWDGMGRGGEGSREFPGMALDRGKGSRSVLFFSRGRIQANRSRFFSSG